MVMKLMIGTRLLLSVAASLFSAIPALAQNTTWNGSADTNFFNDTNWSNTAPDTAGEFGILDSSVDAIIDAGTGSVTLDGVNLGGGNVIQNGGTLNFVAGGTSKFGDVNPASWIMNNDAVLLYDGPLNGAGAGYGSDGLNGSDFDVGNGSSAATFELHDTAILRIADDMKISDNGTPTSGHVLLDGNSQVTVGSGTSVGPDGPGSITVAENALYVSGNSAGPGNTAEGYTNEGYLDARDATILVKDNGRLWVRTLQQRNAESTITLENNARFDIFDVFNHASPVLGTTTVEGDVNGNERTSEVSENFGSKTTITIKNSATMTVDSNPAGASWSGFALSGGTNRGGNNTGGETLIDVQDEGTFMVQQDLNMTLGFDSDATSTLKVRGPNATVAVNGDLRMALDEFDVENPGTAALHAVITALSHSTINVGGDINIDNGDLIVELDGYTPLGGESYTLVSAGGVSGSAFENEDFALAPLLDGLSWDVVVSGSAVLLNVLGTADIPGDFDADNDVDGSDFLTWQRGFGSTYDATDLTDWQTNYGAGSASALAAGTIAVPEPTIGVLLLSAFILVRGLRVTR